MKKMTMLVVAALLGLATTKITDAAPPGITFNIIVKDIYGLPVQNATVNGNLYLTWHPLALPGATTSLSGQAYLPSGASPLTLPAFVAYQIQVSGVSVVTGLPVSVTIMKIAQITQATQTISLRLIAQ